MAQEPPSINDGRFTIEPFAPETIEFDNRAPSTMSAWKQRHPHTSFHTGRPTKLTPELQEVIVKHIRAGSYDVVAAQAAGIARGTFDAWMTRTGAPYEAFQHAVLKARAEAEQRNVMIIEQAAITSWQAAAWWLERKFPDRWGLKQRIEVVEMVKREAANVARELGITEEEVLRQAEEILARNQ